MEKGNYTSFPQIMSHMRKLINNSHEENPTSYKIIDGKILDNTRLKSLGWDLEYDLTSGLVETIKNYRKFKLEEK